MTRYHPDQGMLALPTIPRPTPDYEGEARAELTEALALAKAARTWFRIYFRRRAAWPADLPVLLVRGEEERDRILVRKTPIAVAWEKAKLHKCTGCGRRGPWTKEWTWRGTWAAIEAGEPIEIACSSSCREAQPKPEGQHVYWTVYEPLKQAENEKRWKVGLSESDRQALVRARRTVPLPEPPKDGKRRCRWCTEEITGRYAHLRSWHHDCKREWLLHYDRDVQARYIAKRDGHDCWDCRRGGRYWRVDLVLPKWSWQGVPDCLFERPKTEAAWTEPFPLAGKKVDGVIVGLYSTIEWRPHCGPLEVDHEIIPLWKVWHLPDDERRRFYGPENLRLRCVPCHKAKSKREAAERAALRTKGPVNLDG